MVRAFGALIAYLMEERVGKDTSSFDPAASVVRRDRRTAEVTLASSKRFQVTSLTRLELDGRLHLEPNVYEYLQIFHEDRHPSALGGAPKEGISLFSFLDQCVSKLGSTTLKQWLLAPLCDPSLIEARLDCIDHLWVWMDNEISEKVCFHLRHARDLRLPLTRMNTGTATSKDWSNLKETCVAAIRLREMVLAEFSSLSSPPNLIHRILTTNEELLAQTIRLITEVLDIASPTSDRKPQIRGGVDAELDRLRGVIADLNEYLDKVAKSELTKYETVSSLRVVYVPQIGFQISIPSNEELPLDHPESPLFRFSSNQCAYYRTKTTQELDSMLGDVSPMMLDRRDAVLRDLAAMILPHTSHLLRCAHWMAELDVMVSMTRVSKENGFVRPSILNPIQAFLDPSSISSGAIRIVGGKHPLLEHVMSKEAKRFVSNSTELSLTSPLGASTASLQVIIGPNGSGKSVYLTQTGLIVFMAHIGCYVPAAEADICVVDHLFTFSSSHYSGAVPIKSKGSIVSITSTGSGVGSFLRDAHNMGRILRNATPLSLILIDEFGRGTVESDAQSLMIAAVEHLCAPRPLRTETESGAPLDSEGIPKVLVSTHLKLLQSSTLLKLAPIVSFFHMNALIANSFLPSNLHPLGNLNPLLSDPTYLYQLMPVTKGYEPPQLGVYCAKLAGMENWVLERAIEIKNALYYGKPLQPLEDAPNAVNMNEESKNEQKQNEALRLLEQNFGTSSLHSINTMDALTFINTIFDPSEDVFST